MDRSNPPRRVLTDSLDVARSFLFVPADRPERYGRALESGADAVIIDLEDAVVPAAREAARSALMANWPGASARIPCLVRINASAATDHTADLVLCERIGATSLVVPKADAASLAALAARYPANRWLPIIESAQGLAEVDSIARVAGVVRLAFGHLDFQLDLGMAAGEDEVELAGARLAIVLASRLAGISTPIDGVTLETGDAARVLAATRRARRFGFGARLVIHPRQLSAVHEGFAPTPAELAWAHRVVEAAGEQARGGGGAHGALQIEGRMVDAPVIAAALAVVARANAQPRGVGPDPSLAPRAA